MAGISDIFNIARSGIRANQQGLATTSHNIANINTKGYSRQEVVLETARPAEGTIGSGVRVAAIRQSVDDFLEKQLTSVNEDLGSITARNNYLVQADGIFTETDNSGLSFSLTEFFNAVRDVATNPESTIQRTVLLAKGQALTDQFVTVAQGLNQIRLDADGEIARHVDTINGLATKIASLNDVIFKTESSGRDALDLLDQRRVLINDLASLVNIEQVPLNDGIGINVGGQLLVAGNHANALSTEADPDNPPMHDVTFVRSDGSELSISHNIHGGQIGGLLAQRDGDMVKFQDQVDRLAAVLINEFNQQHQAGYGLDGTTNNNFFSTLSPQAPLAHDRNTGSATGSSVTIADPTLVTFQGYEVQFSGASAYSVVNTATGATVTSGAYTSGSPLSFDGLDVVINGTPAAGDVFYVNAQKGAAQQFGVALSDTDKIAAASTVAGIPGNNTNALNLVAIHTNRHVDLGNVTLNDYHTITIGDVGSATQESTQALHSKQLEVDQLTALRESVSGVSLDEELTNLLSFQRSFEASARMITVADELMQTMLAMGR
ncbi:MAG: flagellar hook-associated protein FlgK [Nitrospirales bacterium]|nr:flagellar hook-associated protein FlgK [Nitrospirales bacterium]